MQDSWTRRRENQNGWWVCVCVCVCVYNILQKTSQTAIKLPSWITFHMVTVDSVYLNSDGLGKKHIKLSDE